MGGYPRGFAYCGNSDTSASVDWASSNLFSGLRYDSHWHRYAASEGTAAVEVLGTCVPINERITEAYCPAKDLLRSLLGGEEAFFQRLADLCGRFVVFYRLNTASARLLTDATGMRTVFYTRSDKLIVSSHAGLARDNLGADEPEQAIPQQWGYPGISTPWERVKLLTPNTLLDLQSGAISRFYPRARIGKVSVADAAEAVSGKVINALVNFERKYGRLRLGLTAGIDSRTTLALALAAGIQVDSLTYTHNRAATKDARAAAELAKLAGIPHTLVAMGTRKLPQGARKRFERATYYPHNRNVTESLRPVMSSGDTFLSSNLLEIGRAFYTFKRVPVPDSPETAADLYCRLARRVRGKAIVEWGEGRFRGLSLRAFEEFFEVTSFRSAASHVHPYDLLYWEHRMAAWHAQTLLVRDFACDTFIPFNARSIFETLLGVAERDRKKSAVFKRMIERARPELLAIPINGKTRWRRLVELLRDLFRKRLRWRRGRRRPRTLTRHELPSMPRLESTTRLSAAHEQDAR